MNAWFEQITVFFVELSTKNPLSIMWILFLKGGWVIVMIGLLRLWWLMRLYSLQTKYSKTITYTMLAIDIPKASEQTPKAMEQVFATISGAHADFNKKEIYLKGMYQLSFSFEIISIDGYIQFLIRTPSVFRDLIEGAIYAHYPDAEITEVYDYTTDIPTNFPNDRFNLWGAEIETAANEALPLRTYESFEDKLSQELKDPLAGVLETMSRIQKGEQVWLQIIVKPTDTAWAKKCIAYAHKLAGKKTETKSSKSWYSPILGFLYGMFDDWISWMPGSKVESKNDNGLDFKVLNLTPGERATIEAVERKASKIGFVCKIRLMYLSPHEQFSAKRVVSAVFGGMKQFGDLSSNALKPNKRTKTQAVYFRPEQRADARRRRIMGNYKARSWFNGSKYFILNTEELATLYHFPSITVTTPYLKRTEAKKSDAPSQLPSSAEEVMVQEESNLKQQLEGLSLDNSYYEKLYAKGPVEKPKQKATLSTPEKQQPGTPAIESSDGVPHNLPILQ